MEESTVNKKRFSPFGSKRTRAQRERIAALGAEVDSLRKRLTDIEKVVLAAPKAPSGLFSGNALLPSALAYAIFLGIPLAVLSFFRLTLPLEIIGTFALGCSAVSQLAIERTKQAGKSAPILASCGWTFLFIGSAALFIRATGWAG